MNENDKEIVVQIVAFFAQCMLLIIKMVYADASEKVQTVNAFRVQELLDQSASLRQKIEDWKNNG